MSLEPKERDVLRLARTLIRDMAHDWPVRELAAPPEDVCTQISDILDEDYDFEFGEESPRLERTSPKTVGRATYRRRAFAMLALLRRERQEHEESWYLNGPFGEP